MEERRRVLLRYGEWMERNYDVVICFFLILCSLLVLLEWGVDINDMSKIYLSKKKLPVYLNVIGEERY